MLRAAAGTRVDETRFAPNAPLHQLTGLDARLSLRFEADGLRTRLRMGAQDPPWRVIRAFPHQSGAAFVHLHNVSGGVLAGDRLRLDIEVEAGAAAQITSTGATRLHRHRVGARDSEQIISISVAGGGLLEYLPDAVIPFAGSRHRQRTEVRLAEGAVLFWWEILAPGRQAMGEEFAFDALQVETAIHSPARPLLLENYLLEPQGKLLRSNARLGPYSYLANFYAMHVGRAPADWLQLETALNEIACEESRPGVTIFGASALAADGIIVRGLSATARNLPATLARFWTTARRFLTGVDAVPPRKLR